jgi:cytochrome o ubiquinol oxidase subunit IV
MLSYMLRVLQRRPRPPCRARRLPCAGTSGHCCRRALESAGPRPGIPVGLIVLALAQIGVHLVFFLHLGSGPDSTNNILALAFGVLIVFLVISGSVWIIANLNSNLMPMPQ